MNHEKIIFPAIILEQLEKYLRDNEDEWMNEKNLMNFTISDLLEPLILPKDFSKIWKKEDE